MLKFKTILLSSVALSLLLFFSSCEHSVTTESVVHEDGSIDRMVALSKADSNAVQQNMFGINAQKGWDVAMELEEESKDKKYSIAFRKHFASVDEANAEMNAPGDTLFKINSEFKKEFRWFFTYIEYRDTYLAINRFKEPDVSDYFTQEDFAFIDRLPAEGESISLADSLYLKTLNDKIYDVYAARAFYDVYYNALIETVTKNQLEKRWIDTLNAHKENLFQHLLKNEDDFDDDFMLKFADSLKLPLPSQSKEDYHEIVKPLEKQIDFMSWAGDGKYKHAIKMPWDVISTNADSVIENELHWAPPVTKFLLRDYTMFAKARKMNVWAVGVSVLFIVFTIWMFMRKRK